MTPLKVLLLFEFSSLNGGEHSMLSVVRHFHDRSVSPQAGSVRRQIQFAAATERTGLLVDELRRLDIPLHHLAVRDPHRIKRSPTELEHDLKAILREDHFDVVHANSLSMCRNLVRMPAAIFGDARRTGHIRDIMKLSGKAIQELSTLDHLIAVSDATRNHYLNQGLPATRLTTVYNGFQIPQFGVEDEQSVRQQLFPDLPSNSVLLLNVGQICLRKGQVDLARAVCRLIDQDPKFHMVLAGARHSSKAESIEYEQEIQTIFRDARITEHLHLLGYRSDIPQLMNACDLLVHAAKQEPLGRTLLEAAGCGLPVVATDVGGTREIFPTDEYAILVDPSPDGLFQGIQAAFADRERLTARVACARRRIESRLTVSQSAERIAEIWAQQE